MVVLFECFVLATLVLQLLNLARLLAELVVLLLELTLVLRYPLVRFRQVLGQLFILVSNFLEVVLLLLLSELERIANLL